VIVLVQGLIDWCTVVASQQVVLLTTENLRRLRFESMLGKCWREIREHEKKAISIER
jgi:hypothetical protein